MTLPLVVRALPRDLPAAPAFACTMCGDCCSDLRQARQVADEAWPRLSPRGLYPLDLDGGLPVWAWEAHRLRREAAALGLPPLRFVPSVVAFDDLASRAIVLLHALDADVCPMLGPGPTEGTRTCGAYEARPLVCRAFPLVVSRGALVPSRACGAVVEPQDASEAAFRHAFGDGAFDAGRASGRVGGRLAAALSFLETAGALRLARGLTRDAVDARLAAWPHVDAWTLLRESAAIDETAWWLSLQPDDVRVVTPAP